MAEMKELAESAEGLAAELKRLSECGADLDSLEEMKDRSAELAADLADAWDDAYESELAEND